MGAKLTNAEEVLYRQIHPTFMHEGVPSSGSFMPSKKDEHKLSLDRSSLVTAEASHVAYLATGLESEAVYGLEVREFGAEAIDCEEDPIERSETAPENKAHALADYSPFNPSKQKNISKRLKIKAVARGCLHPPAANDGGAVAIAPVAEE